MNMLDLIRHRYNCPMCGEVMPPPSFLLRSCRIDFEEDSINFSYVMKELRANQPDYEAVYCFGLSNNSFSIRLKSEWNNGSFAQKHLTDKFKEFDKNVRNNYSAFHRICDACHRYTLNTTRIDLDFKTSTYTLPEIDVETYTFVEDVRNSTMRIIRLDNFKDHSELWWWRIQMIHDDELSYPLLPVNPSKQVIDTVIPFVSVQETRARLNKLITFA